MWHRFKRLFKKPLDWLGTADEAQEMDPKFRLCPGCNTSKDEQGFGIDDLFRVVCLDCLKAGHPRKAFESFDDLVKAEPPSSAPS